MDLLVLAGYASKSGDAYRWTNKANPAMRFVSGWSPDTDDLEATYEALEEQEAEAALWSMPLEIENALLERPDDFIYFVAILNRHWRDGRWHPMAEHEGGTALQGGLGLPKRFMRKFSEMTR